MRTLAVLFLSISGALPVSAQSIDRIQDFRTRAIWQEIEKQPYAKAHSGMPEVDQIIIYGDGRSSSVVGLMQRKNWLAGETLAWENGFSVMVMRPCFQVLPECFKGEGLWMEVKRAEK